VPLNHRVTAIATASILALGGVGEAPAMATDHQEAKTAIAEDMSINLTEQELSKISSVVASAEPQGLISFDKPTVAIRVGQIFSAPTPDESIAFHESSDVCLVGESGRPPFSWNTPNTAVYLGAIESDGISFAVVLISENYRPYPLRENMEVCDPSDVALIPMTGDEQWSISPLGSAQFRV